MTDPLTTPLSIMCKAIGSTFFWRRQVHKNNHHIGERTGLGCWLVGCIEDLRHFSGISAISQLGSRRLPISEIQVVRPGIKPPTSCSASQELNHSATTAPRKDRESHPHVHDLQQWWLLDYHEHTDEIPLSLPQNGDRFNFFLEQNTQDHVLQCVLCWLEVVKGFFWKLIHKRRTDGKPEGIENVHRKCKFMI